MGTLVDSVESDSPPFQELAEAAVYGLSFIFCDEPAANTGLITDHNQQKSAPAQLGERFHHARQQFDIGWISYVPAIDNQRSVAIEEKRSARRVAQST